MDKGNHCWTRSRETHRDYELLFVEFDDQGWVRSASRQSDPAQADHLSTFYTTINQMADASTETGGRLTFVVFVHGWQHSADAMDFNVQAVCDRGE